MALFSCSKDDISNQENNFTEKDYYPGTQELAKQEILEFLQTTKTFNNSTAKSTSTYQDREPSEGKWVMEGASNYLTNNNLSGTSSDTIIKIDIDVENLLATDGTIKMKGTDMSSKFDNIFSQIEAYATSTGKVAKLVDIEIKQVDASKTELIVRAIFGQQGGGNVLSQYPNGLFPFEVFELYEPDLLAELGSNPNNFYTNIDFGFIFPYTFISDVTNPNYTPQQDMTSPLFNTNLPQCGQYNNTQDCRVCFDCLWAGQINPISGTWSSATSDYYYQGTKTVVQNFMNNGNYETRLLNIDIEYNTWVCGCSNGGWEQISNMMLGKGNSY
jgi:hypothetical protein